MHGADVRAGVQTNETDIGNCIEVARQFVLEVAKCSLQMTAAHKQEDERKGGREEEKRMESWRQTRDSKVSNGERNTFFGFGRTGIGIGGGSTIPLPVLK